MPNLGIIIDYRIDIMLYLLYIALPGGVFSSGSSSCSGGRIKDRVVPGRIGWGNLKIDYRGL